MDNVSSAHPNPAPNRNDSVPPNSGPSQPHRPEPAPAAATPATAPPAPAAPGISRAPLNLGGTASAPPAAAPVAPKAPVVRPAPPRPAPAAAGDRITTCKTFFTKLHPGAILFLEGQINEWLKNNPGIVIKRTDVTVGEILEKKSEPSMIIVVWY